MKNFVALMGAVGLVFAVFLVSCSTPSKTISSGEWQVALVSAGTSSAQLVCTNVQVDPDKKSVTSDCTCSGVCNGVENSSTAKCTAKNWNSGKKTLTWSCTCDFLCGFGEQPEVMPEPTPEPIMDAGMELTPEPVMDAGSEPAPEVMPEPTPEPVMDAGIEPAPEPTPEPIMDAGIELAPEVMPEPQPEPAPESTPDTGCPQGEIMTVAGMCVPDVATNNDTWTWMWYVHTDGFTYIYFWGTATGCDGYLPGWFDHYWFNCKPANPTCVSAWSDNVQPVTSYLKGGKTIYVVKKPMGYELGHPFNQAAYNANGVWPTCWRDHVLVGVGKCDLEVANPWQCKTP